MILANSQINPDDLTTGSIAELIDQGYVGASECARLKRKGGPMILASRLFPNFEIGILEVLPSVRNGKFTIQQSTSMSSDTK